MTIDQLLLIELLIRGDDYRPIGIDWINQQETTIIIWSLLIKLWTRDDYNYSVTIDRNYQQEHIIIIRSYLIELIDYEYLHIEYRWTKYLKERRYVDCI